MTISKLLFKVIWEEYGWVSVIVILTLILYILAMIIFG